MPTVSVFSRMKLSSLRFAKHSGAARSLDAQPAGVDEPFDLHDHDMDSLVAATRLELGSRCLELGDYEGSVVAFTAVLQHAPHLAARAAEAQRGLLQCQKGLKLEALGAPHIDSDAAMEETLQQLGIPQWHTPPSSPAPKASGARPIDDPTSGVRDSGSPATMSAPGLGLEPEQFSSLLEPEPEPEPEPVPVPVPQPEPEPEPEQQVEGVLVTRSSLLSQVETLHGSVQNLQAELAKKSEELHSMKSQKIVADVVEQRHRELQVSRRDAMRQDIKGAMKAEKLRRCANAMQSCNHCLESQHPSTLHWYLSMLSC